MVSPDQRFEYDPLYRLTQGTGRESQSLGQPTHSELTPGPQPDPDDPAALRTYVQTYAYDEVGNLTQVQHTATNGNWTRGYDYASAGNRLNATSLPGDTVGDPATYSATYTHDAHGNMTSMPHLATIDWDHADRMQHCDLGGGGDVWFVYDGAGNRVRKVQVNQSGTTVTERIYLGGLELYRQTVSGTLDSERAERARGGRHGADLLGGDADGGRGECGREPGERAAVPVCESPGDGAAGGGWDGGGDLVRGVCAVRDGSYRAANSGIEVSAKRYRYIGKERDEETGLDHWGRGTTRGGRGGGRLRTRLGLGMG